MKKLILALLTIFMIIGCDRSKTDNSVIDENWTPSPEFTTFKVIRYEGCQYILYDRGITHKGNCDNPIHKK